MLTIKDLEKKLDSICWCNFESWTPPLYEIFSLHLQDISSIFLEYLDSTSIDLFCLKVASKLLHQLVNRVVPLHNFVSILHALKNNSPLPELHIPNSFVLEQKMVYKIWNPNRLTRTGLLLKCYRCSVHAASKLCTTFIVTYHSHPFCLQVVAFFPHDKQQAKS